MTLRPVPELDADPQVAPPVIVHLPSDLGGLDVMVQHYASGPVASIREAGIGMWTPAILAGCEIEVRQS